MSTLKGWTLTIQKIYYPAILIFQSYLKYWHSLRGSGHTHRLSPLKSQIRRNNPSNNIPNNIILFRINYIFYFSSKISQATSGSKKTVPVYIRFSSVLPTSGKSIFSSAPLKKIHILPLNGMIIFFAAFSITRGEAKMKQADDLI